MHLKYTCCLFASGNATSDFVDNGDGTATLTAGFSPEMVTITAKDSELQTCLQTTTVDIQLPRKPYGVSPIYHVFP